MMIAWLLGWYAGALIMGASCYTWADDETGEVYLETAVELAEIVDAERPETEPGALYRLTIAVNSTRSMERARVLYSDTLRASGDYVVAPAHPMPEVEGRLLMGARAERADGTADEVWVVCELDGGGP